VVAIAYPLFDLLLIAMIVGLASAPNVDIGPRWGFLVGGLGIFTAGDVAYALLDHNGAYVVGTPLDAVWALGLALIAWWVDGIERPHPRRPTRPRYFVFPAAAIAVVAGLAVLILATQIAVSPLAMAFASATVVLAAVPVMFRQAVLTRLLAGQARVVEQLRELDRAKSEMMATINHELRTPLTSIRGYLELVTEGEGGTVPKAAAEMLRVAAHNANRLEALVDDMTMLSRLEEGEGSGERAPVSVLGILTHASEALYPAAAARSITVDVDGIDGLLVAADGGQLERAFTKIAENAVKFTKDGGHVQLRVEAGGTANHRTAIVTFVDSGIGIPTADIEKVFSPFFRAANAQSYAIAGAGLGLAIVRYLVEAHDGEITVSSTEGVGTRVQIELPVVSAADH
jgi:signal transduction histidine kinase